MRAVDEKLIINELGPYDWVTCSDQTLIGFIIVEVFLYTMYQ